MAFDPITGALEPVTPADVAVASRASPVGPGVVDNPPIPRLNPMRAAAPAATPAAPADPIVVNRTERKRPRLMGGRFGEIGDTLGDIATGVAGTPSGAGPIGAFAHGFSGAQRAETARLSAAREAEIAAEDRRLAMEDRQYDRDRDAADDARKAAEDARAQQELDAKIEGGYFTKTAGGNNLVDADGELTPEGVETVWDMTAEESNSLRDFYQQTTTRSNSEKVAKKIKRQTQQYREDLEAAIKAGKNPKSVPRPSVEDVAGGREPTDPVKPKLEGKGTRKKPYTGFTTADEVMENVKPGEYFVDENGQLRQL